MKLIRKISRFFRNTQSSYYDYRRMYYDQILENKLHPSYFLKHLRNYHRCENFILTDKVFKAKGMLDFGVSVDFVLDSWGKPTYLSKSINRFSHQILIYRAIIGGIKGKYELHFINNQLFSYSLKFAFLSIDQKAMLIDTILLKYVAKKSDVSIDKLRLFDKNDNLLYIERQSDLIINYVSGDESLFNIIELELEMKKAKEKSIKHKRELELFYCL